MEVTKQQRCPHLSEEGARCTRREGHASTHTYRWGDLVAKVAK